MMQSNEVHTDWVSAELPRYANRLKELMISELFLDRSTVEEIDDDEVLFGEGLDLDSVDTLQLVLAIEKDFDLKIETKELDRDKLATVRSMAGFVQSKVHAKAAGPRGD